MSQALSAVPFMIDNVMVNPIVASDGPVAWPVLYSRGVTVRVPMDIVPMAHGAHVTHECLHAARDTSSSEK